MGTKFPQEQRASLSNQFTNELMKPSVDLATDFSEIFIDDLIENEVLKEIPIVKSIVGVINTGISINQFFFAKKLLTFIQEFNSGKIDQKKREEFHQRLIEDDKYRKKTTEQIMVFLDRI